jgi:hypothetical protein
MPAAQRESSTPSTVTVPITGSGRARIHRNNVLRVAGNPSAVANRAPARPANANPIDSSMPRNNTVHRA